MEAKMTMAQIRSIAYDPQKTSFVFDGHRVTGFAHPLKYRRIDEWTHELYLQVTSDFLKKVGKGNTGVFHISVHTGGESTLPLNLGITSIHDIIIKELSGDSVPTATVVMKNL